jgi:hypothetical protein
MSNKPLVVKDAVGEFLNIPNCRVGIAHLTEQLVGSAGLLSALNSLSRLIRMLVENGVRSHFT